MKAIAALLVLTICSGVTLVQARRCYGIVWNNRFYGVCTRAAQFLKLLTDIVNKIEEESRQNLANLHVDNIDLEDIGSIKNITIKNLELFEVANLQLGDIHALEVKNLSVAIDVLRVEGTYDLVNLNIPSVGGISGKGNFSIDLNDVTISASLTFAPDGLTKIIVKDITNIRVNVDSALAVLEGIQGGDAVNDALSAVIPNAVRKAIPQLLESKKQVLTNFLNNILNNNGK